MQYTAWVLQYLLLPNAAPTYFGGEKMADRLRDGVGHSPKNCARVSFLLCGSRGLDRIPRDICNPCIKPNLTPKKMRLFCVFKDSKEKATSSTKQSSVSPPLGSLAIPLALACLPGGSLSLPHYFMCMNTDWQMEACRTFL